jgi:hypothetical protein
MNITTLNNLAVLHIIRVVVVVTLGRLCMCSCTYKEIIESLSHMVRKAFSISIGRYRFRIR